MKYNILIIDDELDNLQLLARTFRKKYHIFMASSGSEGLEILAKNQIDLIISDHKMPGMDGIEFFKRSIEVSPDSLRVLVTAYSDPSLLINAINTGKVHRYVKKPWDPNDLVNIIGSVFEVYQLSIDNQELALDFKELFSGTILAITEALDAKDSFTFGRSKRVAFYSVKIAKYLQLSEADIGKIELAGLLHDIGMIGVPENIINKPDNLNEEEYAAIKKHVELGAKILEEIKQLESVINIIKYHHERYDGTGYPSGIRGEEIPIGSRIISVADSYDSMTSERAYRSGLTHESAIAEIKKSSGTQLDPNIVEAFLAIAEDAHREIIQIFPLD